MFYGELSKVQNHLLFHLKLLKLLPPTETRNGFYAIESRYGREIPKKLALDPACHEGEAVLLYRYLSEEELQNLETTALKSVVFYILPHKMFDRDYIKKTLLPRVPQAGFISDFSGSSLVHSFNLVRKEFKAGNILRLKSTGQNQSESESSGPMIQLPVLILFLLKIFMNPVNEIRRYSLLIKYSNLRILSRFFELFLAVDFVINAVVIRLLRLLVLRIWYSSHYLVGFYRVVLIKLGFGIRHVFLMSGFKSYGLVVDTYFSVLRWASSLLQLVFYRGLYFLYYRVGYFLFYGVFYFLYYRIFLTGYAVLRHAVLISIFRLYGLAFDICTFSYRIAKLKLLYPVFKIYWFLAFQYEKRIKKLLS